MWCLIDGERWNITRNMTVVKEKVKVLKVFKLKSEIWKKLVVVVSYFMFVSSEKSFELFHWVCWAAEQMETLKAAAAPVEVQSVLWSDTETVNGTQNSWTSLRKNWRAASMWTVWELRQVKDSDVCQGRAAVWPSDGSSGERDRAPSLRVTKTRMGEKQLPIL